MDVWLKIGSLSWKQLTAISPCKAGVSATDADEESQEKAQEKKYRMQQNYLGQ